ncbi:hypothetical protein AB9K26_07145 [Psychroserpens sp. XS_ASV72]|uniref:hypothetical protein n=1 Tax=Psychroserpens sp. XS_ASV72 TaxID=3241293 RepID=UPI00351658D5
MTRKKVYIILISFILLACSSDDSDSNNNNNFNNGFVVNGQFYETNYVAIPKVNSQIGNSLPSYYIELFSNFDLDFLGRFALYPDGTSTSLELVTGTYPTDNSNTFNSPGTPRTVSEKIIEFRDNSGPGFDILVYSENTDNTGTVTINSITNVLDMDGFYTTTEIDIEYTFTGTDGTVVVGNYSGPVDFTSTP